jgi:nicotinamide riboside kinase
MTTLRTSFKIAILGAESTGKSQLAQALAQHFSQQGWVTHRVDEYLREWCDLHQRTPQQHEQVLMAQTQMARVQEAPAQAIVIADTTPIMTAVYSQMLFQDHSLDDIALSHHQLFDVTFITGLDLPWVADGLQRDGPHVRAPVDAAIRSLLAKGNIAYQVVYGQGEERLTNALHGLAQHAPALQNLRQEIAPRWTGPCETCGDGDCEHRLFTELLK